jgi:dCTP deaminase
MIQGFVAEKVSESYEATPLLSYGLEPSGYTARLGEAFKMGPASLEAAQRVLDPKRPPRDADYEQIVSFDPIMVGPGSMVSGVTIERFHLPPDVQGLCIGKSSYTRLGLITQFTGIEPGFEGTLTVQLINVGGQAVQVYPGEGILQILFWVGAMPKTSYTGAYQGQTGVVTGRGSC